MNIKYGIGIVLIIIIIILMSLMANIERQGYLSEFDLVEIYNDNNIYDARIKYNSSIFRNSDIFSVYVNTNKLPDNIILIPQESGSPFYQILVSKDTVLNENIDIFYKLKLKGSVYIIAILLCLLFVILIFFQQLKHIIFNFKLYYFKGYLLFYIIILSIFLILLFISNIERTSAIVRLEEIAHTKSGYVYKGFLSDDKLLFSGLFNYRNGSIDFVEQPSYIRKGYYIEFLELPAWYDTNNANIYFSNDSLIFSNAYTYNAFNYEVPISVGEHYQLDLSLKVLQILSNDMLKWDISDSRNFEYISIGNFISNEYFVSEYVTNIYINKEYSTNILTNEYITSDISIQLNSTVEIKEENIESKYSKRLHINFPHSSLIEVNNIKLSQLDNQLFAKSDNSIVFTSDKKLNILLENIQIKHKISLNHNSTVLFIILTLIMFIVICIKFRLYIFNIYNKLYQNEYGKIIIDNIYIIIILVIIILGIYLRVSYRPCWIWDTMNYIANGMYMITLGRVQAPYPGTLFSLIHVSLMNFIFNNIQNSYVMYMQIIPTSIVVIFTYKILRMFVSKTSAICYLLLIFFIYNIPTSISHILIVPYTDSWLLMFSTIVVYLVLKDKLIAAGILIAIAHYYRVSQALPVLIFTVVLIREINIKKVIIYLSTIFLSIFIIKLILNSFFDLGYNDFYMAGFQERNIILPFTSLNIKDIFLDIVNVFWGYRIANIPILVGLTIALAYTIYVKYSDIKHFNIKKLILNLTNLDKIFIFSFLIYCSCFVGGLYVQQVFGNRSEILIRPGENRYFIYPFLFSTMIGYIYLDINTKTSIIFRRIFVIVLIMVSIVSYSYNIYKSINNNMFYNMIHYFDYTEDYPYIEKGSKYIFLDISPAGITTYIFKPETLNYVTIKNPNPFEVINDYNYFYTNDNSNIDYVFASYGLKDNYYVKDSNGIIFKRYWVNGLKDSEPYSLFKKVTNYNNVLDKE